MNLGTLQADLGANTAMLRADLARAKRLFVGFSRSVTAPLRIVRNSLNRIRSAFFGIKTMIAGTVAIMATRSFIKFGAAFERTMSIVRVVSEATNKEMEKFRTQVKALGETTEFTATEAGEALKFLSMAGLSVVQAMGSLPHTLDLATAGQIGLGRAADISTNIMSQMALEVRDLTMVNDALVAVQSTANTNIEEASQAFVYAGAKARTFGTDVVQLASLIGILANNGIKATMAGTTLRQSMIKLIKPTSDGKAILKEYGIEVQNVDGTLRSFVDVIKEMADAQLNATEITTLFGARAGNIELILKSGSQAIGDYIDKVRSMRGVAKSAADTIRSDILGSLMELKSALQGVVLRAWDRYKDGIQANVKAATKFVRKHSDDVMDILGALEHGVKNVLLKPGFAAEFFPELGGMMFDALLAGSQAFLRLSTAFWDVFLDPFAEILWAKMKAFLQNAPSRIANWAKEKEIKATIAIYKKLADLSPAGPGKMMANIAVKDAERTLDSFYKHSRKRMEELDAVLDKEYGWNMQEARELDPKVINRARESVAGIKPDIVDPFIRKQKERFKPYMPDLPPRQTEMQKAIADRINDLKRINEGMAARIAKDMRKFQSLPEGAPYKDVVQNRLERMRSRYEARKLDMADPQQLEDEINKRLRKEAKAAEGVQGATSAKGADNSVNVSINVENLSGGEEAMDQLKEVAEETVENALKKRDQRLKIPSNTISQNRMYAFY